MCNKMNFLILFIFLHIMEGGKLYKTLSIKTENIKISITMIKRQTPSFIVIDPQKILQQVTYSVESHHMLPILETV